MTHTNTTERDALLETAKRDLAAFDRAKPKEYSQELCIALADSLRSLLNRTANASEASVRLADFDHTQNCSWISKDGASCDCGYQHVVQTLEPYAIERDAAPPSDRAAVEGVSEAELKAAFDVLRKHRVVVANIPWEAMREAIAAARASDTNAAAAPAGQAVNDIIAERDHCEEVIDEILDCVLGTDRPEWSSSYGYADAIRDVENMTTPRAAFRQPTIEDAEKLREHFVSLRMVRPARDDEPKVAMLAALKHIGCVIPADRGEGGA